MLADIVVILIVAFFIATGWKKGLMKSVLGLASFALSLIIAFLIYPKVTELLAGTSLYSFLEKAVSEGYIAKHMNNGGMLGILQIEKYIAGSLTDSITDMMLKVISFVITLIASRVIIWIGTKILNLVSKLPGINFFNKLGGGLVGGVKGIAVLYIAFAIAVVFVPFKENGKVTESIEKSKLASELYHNNIVLNLMHKGETGI